MLFKITLGYKLEKKICVEWKKCRLNVDTNFLNGFSMNCNAFMRGKIM